MKLTTIRLINWHQFWDNTIKIESNTLLTGENGSGKSTLLDAIFFVLSGGESKMFNKAANNESGRTIESYMRCKLGVEGKTCLRNQSELISHIALEFKDESSSQKTILGAVMEIRGDAESKCKFYVLENTNMSDMLFIDDGNIMGMEGFKKHYGNALFSDLNKSKRQNRASIVKILGLNRNADQKYYDLLCKAIAFDPLKGNVSQFVNDFLLKENNVSIASLQNELRSYREINANISREKAKRDALKRFIEKAQQYWENVRMLSYLDILKIDNDISTLSVKSDKYRRDLVKYEEENKSLTAQKDSIEQQRESEWQTLNNLKNQEQMKALTQAKQNLGNLKNRSSDYQLKISTWDGVFTSEAKLIQLLGFSYDFKRNIREFNFPLLNSHISAYIKERKAKETEYTEIKFKFSTQLKAKKDELSNVKADLAKLRSNINNYQTELVSLISEIRDAIARKYKKEAGDIIIQPLCECFEIIDDEWTNAIEGYLNTQRFDLIVEPEYYSDAVSIANKHKDLRYGIIDVKQASGDVKSCSLFEKIRIENPLADGILRCLLGAVICVDTLAELSSHRVAISKSCMIYRNYTARNLNKKAYDIPYIGKTSVIRRIQQLEEKQSHLNSEIKDIDASIQHDSAVLKKISESKLTTAVAEDYWTLKRDCDNAYEKALALVKELESNQDMMAIFEQIEDLEKAIREKSDGIRNCETRIQSNNKTIAYLTVEVDNNDATISGLRDKRQTEYEALKDNLDFEDRTQGFVSDGHIAIDEVDQEIERRNNFNNSNNNLIFNGMTEYANNFSKGLFANCDSIPDFVAEYNKLKQSDIPALQSKARKILEETLRDFNDNFISVIRQKIEEGKAEIKSINRNLRSHPFGSTQEVYEFITDDSGDQEMRDYYRIIMSGKDMEQRDLFTERLDAKDREIISRLFAKLSADEGSQESNIIKYLDYRNYLSYDIRINYGNGDTAKFSKIHKEKSGGETQTPFYVVIGSCFDELINKRDNSNASSLVVFDEAFNNMDELRIQSLMGFYKELNLQLMIVVPSNRCHNLIPYVDSVVGLVANSNAVSTYNLENQETL